MIYLITGLPGNGKTLYTLWHIRDRAKKENRPVFISGVPDLAITEWNQIDEDAARNWYNLPDGAIIVIDEAQRIFRPRAGRGEPPAHVSQLETHRHKGYDIYLITQHPSLIDQNVRRLAGTHRHVQRTFGMQRATIHEWGEVHMDCERRREDSSKTQWNYPKDVYSLYKSAEMHTHKVQMPKQVWYLLALIGVLLFCGSWVYFRMSARISGEVPGYETDAKIDKSGAPVGDQMGAHSASFGADRQPLTKKEYIDAMMPRIPEMAHTAPRYDEVTKPVDAPYPVGCIQTTTSCKCYTQQQTTYNTSLEFCRNFVRNGGFFRDWQRPEPASPAGGVPAMQATGGPVRSMGDERSNLAGAGQIEGPTGPES